jgi:hypothetical protein
MRCKALPNRVLVHNMQRGERMVGSLVLLNDNGKEHGIRPRWAQVYDVGEGVNEVKVGQWILIAHGRWTKGISLPKVENPQDKDADYDFIQQIEWPDGALLVSDEEPEDNLVMNSTEYGERKR